jgi:hypothetical protein
MVAGLQVQEVIFGPESLSGPEKWTRKPVDILQAYF